MLLVVAYSPDARTTLQNICRTHEAAVRQQFGRAVLFAETEFSAFLACRLRAKHGADVQVEQTAPFNEFTSVRQAVREAATAYEERDHPSTPYPKFAAGTDHPTTEAMRETSL